MLKKKIILVVFLLAGHLSYSQTSVQKVFVDTVNTAKTNETGIKGSPKQFTATCDFLDAAINSLNSFNSLIKKENYRIKITSFNNPTSSDMGFSLPKRNTIGFKTIACQSKKYQYQ